MGATNYFITEIQGFYTCDMADSKSDIIVMACGLRRVSTLGPGEKIKSTLFKGKHIEEKLQHKMLMNNIVDVDTYMYRVSEQYIIVTICVNVNVGCSYFFYAVGSGNDASFIDLF